MTCKALIKKYLNRQYKIGVLKDNFIVIDVTTNTKYVESIFIDNFIEVFGDNEIFIKLAKDWFSKSVYKINNSLLKFLEKCDISVGSKEIELKMLKRFSNKEITDVFISNYFNLYYTNNFTQNWIDAYLKTIDHIHSSKKIIADAMKELDNENSFQKDLVTKKINDWYSKNVLETKIHEFINNAHIILGRRNWEISYSYPDHVKIYELDDVLKFFENEDSYHTMIIRPKINSWVENKILEINEKIMPKSF